MENRYEEVIEPCCRKQYVLCGYLMEFGVSDVTPDDPEKSVLNLFKSQEQILVLSRFGFIKKLFETLSTNRKYMKAYEVGVSFRIGLSVNSIQLVKNSLNNLKQAPGAQLNTLCTILQAEHIATNPWPRASDGGIHKVLRAAARGGSPQIKLFVKMWEDINRAFDMSARVEVGKTSDMQIESYVDILVCF